MILLQNNFLLVLDVILVALFALYLRRRWREFRPDRLRVFHSDRVKVAWALALGYGAKMIDRTEALFDAHGLDAAQPYLKVTALGLAVWSASCILQVFAGVAWGRRAWLWCALISAALASLLTWAWPPWPWPLPT